MLTHTHFDGDQHVLRLQSPRCAGRATPGSFVHLRCAAELPMRRPLSIMRAQPQEGWIELLYKVTGAGTRALSRALPDSTLSVLGPIGVGFKPHPERPRVLARAKARHIGVVVDLDQLGAPLQKHRVAGV